MHVLPYDAAAGMSNNQLEFFLHNTEYVNNGHT